MLQMHLDVYQVSNALKVKQCCEHQVKEHEHDLQRQKHLLLYAYNQEIVNY